MNRDASPPSEPDPRRLSLESIEEKLRALPLPEVPGELASNLIAAIPSMKPQSPLGSRVVRRWPWIGAVVAICVTVSAAVYSWLMLTNSKPPGGLIENRGATANSTLGKDVPPTSKAVQEYEQAVRFDPFNADAWFSLAKAQADVHRSADAVSSAQKAIDIARSRDRSDLVDTVQAWLRSHRAAEARQSPP
jgi:tetratricopeptide (TPR) repeat protein